MSDLDIVRAATGANQRPHVPPLVGMTQGVFDGSRLYRVGRTTDVENGHPVLDDGGTP